jgi:predicted esterase
MFKRMREEAPGNRQGALGLGAALLGAGALIPEVPPAALDWHPWIAWALLVLGLALGLAGLMAEWRGLRRWSALVPGLVLLAFICGLEWLSAERTVFAFTQARVALSADDSAGHLLLLRPRTGNSDGASLLIVGPQQLDAAPSRAYGRHVASELARRGLTVAWYEGPGAPVSSIAEAVEELGSQPNVSRVGLLGFADGGDVVLKAALQNPAVAFVIAVSTPVVDPEPWSQLDTPVLAIWGMDDAHVHPHRNAQRMAEPLARAGNADAMIRIFMRADHEIRRPAAAPWLPSPFARGYLDLMAGWADDRARQEMAWVEPEKGFRR